MQNATMASRSVDRIDTGPRFTDADAIRLNRMFRGAETEDMLRAVGHGYLMANAPEPLLRRLPLHTLDHNHDGIYAALREAGLVE